VPSVVFDVPKSRPQIDISAQEGAFIYTFKRHRSTFISSYDVRELLFAKLLRLQYESRPSTDQFVSCFGLMKPSAMVHKRPPAAGDSPTATA
jgi:hypothetical protein